MKVFSDKKFIVFLIPVVIISWFVLDIAQIMYDDQTLREAVIGVQSAAILVFIYLLFGSPKSRYTLKFNTIRIEFQSSVKHLVLWVFLSAIIYWSLRFIFDGVLYFWRG